MPRRAPRDLERSYSARQFAAKLRRLADAVESRRAFTIQVAGEPMRIPADAVFNIEHERGVDGVEELEFQLRWRRGASLDDAGAGRAGDRGDAVSPPRRPSPSGRKSRAR